MVVLLATAALAQDGSSGTFLSSEVRLGRRPGIARYTRRSGSCATTGGPDSARARRATIGRGRDAHLHGVGEQDVRLARGAPVSTHDEDVHGVQTLEELEDVVARHLVW